MVGARGAIGAISAMLIACSAPPAEQAPGARTSDRSLEPTADGRLGPTSDSPPGPTSVSSLAPTMGQLAPTAVTFDSARAWKDLEAQVAIGPRPSGSAALQKTRDYILAELKKAGVEARQQIFIARTPLGEVSMANVIATIPGRRPERLAIASHYDTKRTPFTSPSGAMVNRFVGASDGASSTAALLELARALKARQNEFTIELIFFDGEEATLRDWSGTDHTYGSQHYVDTARRAAIRRSARKPE